MSMIGSCYIKWFDTSFMDLKLVPKLNTMVGIIFKGSDNPHPIYVQVIGYNGKVSELDSFIVLVSYHGVLLERRLDRIYPIPLSIDAITQLGWSKLDEIERGDGINYRDSYRNLALGTILSNISIRVMYYPLRGKKDRWVLSLRDVSMDSTMYYKVRWFHDLSNILEFLKGIYG